MEGRLTSFAMSQMNCGKLEGSRSGSASMYSGFSGNWAEIQFLFVLDAGRYLSTN